MELKKRFTTLKDINSRTDLKYKWEPIKEGRKVVGIRFIIGESGPILQKKRQTKEAQKKQREKLDAADQRKPHLDAARQCRLDHGIKAGDTCRLAKPQCQFCRQTTGVQAAAEPTLF